MILASSPAVPNSCQSVSARVFVRKLSDHAVGILIALLVLAGYFDVSNSANAQTSSSKPEACLETCTKEKQSCNDQLISKELCTHEFDACTKGCDKK